MERLKCFKPLGTFVGLALCAYLAAGIVTTVVAEWRRPILPLPEVKGAEVEQAVRSPDQRHRRPKPGRDR